jgi:hypothetical protein
MRDHDIRQALRADLAERHRHEAALIVDELRLCQGDARVDVAVVNGAITGYEIKSEHDTLRRLPKQLELYSRVCDFVVVVVGPRYCERVKARLPEWCGLVVATADAAGAILFKAVREPQQNAQIDAESRAQLLWRDEAIAILEEHGMATGHRSKPRFRLWSILASLLPAADLNDAVREAIKARGDWRSGQRHAPGDVTS